jgi:hypothetical protein
VIVTYGGGYDDRVRLWTLEQVENAEKDSELSENIKHVRADHDQRERKRVEAEREAEEERREEKKRDEEQRLLKERRQRQLDAQVVVDLKDIDIGGRR